MARVVKAGDDIRKGITATWVNEQNKSRTKAQRNTVEPFSETPITVRCLASASIEFDRFEAANIVGPAVPYSAFGTGSFQYSTLFSEINKTLTPDKWGIVQSPCVSSISSRLVVLGVTWALFDYTDGHTHVEVVSGALTSGTSGKAIILSPPESAGLPGLILIRGGESGIGRIEFEITSATTVDDSNSPYDGMRELTVKVVGPSCNRASMLDQTGVKVYEHDPQCLTLEETDAALVGRKGWAFEGIFQDQSDSASPGDATPCHWVLDGLCCP